jgi:hypothetical protein
MYMCACAHNLVNMLSLWHPSPPLPVPGAEKWTSETARAFKPVTIISLVMTICFLISNVTGSTSINATRISAKLF